MNEFKVRVTDCELRVAFTGWSLHFVGMKKHRNIVANFL